MNFPFSKAEAEQLLRRWEGPWRGPGVLSRWLWVKSLVGLSFCVNFLFWKDFKLTEELPAQYTIVNIWTHLPYHSLFLSLYFFFFWSQVADIVPHYPLYFRVYLAWLLLRWAMKWFPANLCQTTVDIVPGIRQPFLGGGIPSSGQEGGSLVGTSGLCWPWVGGRQSSGLFLWAVSVVSWQAASLYSSCWLNPVYDLQSYGSCARRGHAPHPGGFAMSNDCPH